MVDKVQSNIMIRDSLHKISKMKRANQWLFDNIKPYLGKRILDAGCGNGNITSYLRDRERVVAVDYNEQIIRDLQQRLSDFHNLDIVRSDLLGDSFVSMAIRENIDTIVCINTLEHIENDTLVVNNFSEIIPAGGRVILLVPAFKYLYSSLDEAAGHFKRYGRRELIDMMIAARFDIQHITYFNLFGALGWFLNGKVLKRRELSENALNLFDSLVKVFIFIEKIMHVPFGASLLVVGRKI